MAAIRSKDTKPEMIVRKGLWKRGFRYRLNYKRLPGHPDLVLRKYRTCIFVNGCFWHGHYTQFITHNSQIKIEDSTCCKIPKTNREFWVKKIRRNMERDREEQKKLASMGWHCITIWECELKPKVREQTLESLAYTLNHIWLQDIVACPRPLPKGREMDDVRGVMESRKYEITEEDQQMLMAAEEEEERLK